MKQQNEDRNERNRTTIEQMNGITTVRWPEELGGDPIEKPRGVLLLGGTWGWRFLHSRKLEK